MRPEKSDAAWLWDMLDSARSVVELIRGMSFDEYQQDRRTRRAVEREVEIIGEAARNVSEAFQLSHADIPWRKIMAQRHIIAHEYAELQDEILWKVATFHVPALIVQLEPLVPPAPPTAP